MANLMTVIPPSLHRGFVALGVRNYRLYWTGQVISRVGTWMQQVSLPWLVLVLGGSPLQLGIVAALEFVPSMVLAPFGGVVADRIDKRRAIVVTQDHDTAAAQLRQSAFDGRQGRRGTILDFGRTRDFYIG